MTYDGSIVINTNTGQVVDTTTIGESSNYEYKSYPIVYLPEGADVDNRVMALEYTYTYSYNKCSEYEEKIVEKDGVEEDIGGDCVEFEANKTTITETYYIDVTTGYEVNSEGEYVTSDVNEDI